MLAHSLLLMLCAAPAFAHGGRFRPPRATGAGTPTAGAPRPASPGAANPAPGGASRTPGTAGFGDLVSWSQWWSLNKSRYLDLRSAVRDGGPVTGTDDYPLGRGAAAPRGGGLPSPAIVRERVVPALIAALGNTEDPDLATGALLALAKIGATPLDLDRSLLASAIKPFLAHRNQEIHETATIALGVLGDPAHAPLLAALAQGEDEALVAIDRARVPERTRAFAIYGLGQVGATASSPAVREFIVHHLAPLARSSVKPVPDRAVAAVLALGLVPLPNGERSSAGATPEPLTPLPSRSRAGEMHYLIELLSDETVHDRVRAFAPVALARLERGASSHYSHQLAVLFANSLRARKQEGVIVQQGLVQALALLGDAGEGPSDELIRETLFEVARESGRLTRSLALVALGRVAGKYDPSLAEDEARAVRTYLVKQLSRGSTSRRPWAALGLGLYAHGQLSSGRAVAPEVLASLRSGLDKAKAVEERGALAIALGLANDRSSTPALLALVREGDEGLRGHAATALGLIGAREALPELRAIVRDATYRPTLLLNASIALALLRDRELASQLVTRLSQSERLYEQVSVAAALGWVGDSRTVEPLLAILADEEAPDTTRAFTAVALGLVCERSPLPWNAKFAEDVAWWEAPLTLLAPSSGKGLLDLL